MQIFIAIAALFAGLVLGQDFNAINGLPACGVSDLSTRVAELIDLH